MNLEKNGFCKLKLLEPSNLEALQKVYRSFLSKNGGISEGMSVSHNQGSIKENFLLSEELKSILGNPISRIFPEYDLFLAHFAIKKAKCQHSFQLHKDWNIVDEREQKSIQIWIPLTLSYPENGGVCFVPGSHRFETGYRSGSYGIPRIEIGPELYPFLSYTRLVPGEAVAFFTNILHGSFSNPSQEDRVAVLVNLVPKKSLPSYYHFNPNSLKTEVYPVSSMDILSHLNKLEMGEMPFEFPPLIIVESSNPEFNLKLDSAELLKWIEEDRSKSGHPTYFEFQQFEIIREESIRLEVNSKGYSVIKFLGEEEVKQLKKLFLKYFPDRKPYRGRYNSLDNLTDEKRKLAHDEIVSIIGNRLDAFFKDYLCPISVLYSKQNDGVADTDWHSDPHFLLNQHLEPFYSIWCPLQFTNDLNGVLHVVPYSHRLSYQLVNPNYEWNLASFRPEFSKHSITFELQAGEAILFDSRLIHSSPPNISAGQRDCVVMKVSHKEARFSSVTPSAEKPGFFDVYTHDQVFFFENTVKHHEEKPLSGDFEGYLEVFDSSISLSFVENYFKNKHEMSV
jgi:ectoine hydroxylase-related dioxygenase (phytanoyl-CoA dioxygenase family)